MDDRALLQPLPKQTHVWTFTQPEEMLKLRASLRSHSLQLLQRLQRRVMQWVMQFKLSVEAWTVLSL